MRTEELVLEQGTWVHTNGAVIDPLEVQLVLVFGNVDTIEKGIYTHQLKILYPNAKIAGASTAGNIQSGTYSEYPMVATLVAFKHGWVEMVFSDNLKNDTLSTSASELVSRLQKEHLKHVFVLLDGLGLNGALFLKGSNAVLKEVSMSGAMAGDDNIFDHTLVIADGIGREKCAVAIGFYGESLHINIGCETGWEEFGAERVVTKSEGNIIYEIDNKPALKLYEDYLGEFIKDLPQSGLRFPLNIREYEEDKEVVRVIMAINEDKSLLFAGDIPQGSIVRLMKTNVNNLIEGAERVAHTINQINDQSSLVIAVSCAGRLSVLKQMVGEELHSLSKILGKQTHICGLYAYGEFAPFSDVPLTCKLHNQTMTLTAIYEEE